MTVSIADARLMHGALNTNFADILVLEIPSKAKLTDAPTISVEVLRKARRGSAIRKGRSRNNGADEASGQTAARQASLIL